jgi:hypothetical protein
VASTPLVALIDYPCGDNSASLKKLAEALAFDVPLTGDFRPPQLSGEKQFVRRAIRDTKYLCDVWQC